MPTPLKRKFYFYCRLAVSDIQLFLNVLVFCRDRKFSPRFFRPKLFVLSWPSARDVRATMLVFPWFGPDRNCKLDVRKDVWPETSLVPQELVQSAPAESPKIIIFRPKLVNNCLNNPQNHFQSVNWTSVILHFQIRHSASQKLLKYFQRGSTSVIYCLKNCRNDKSPVGNFGGADCIRC